MHYCGVVAVRDALQLAIVEEVRATEPPIRLSVVFFEPGSPAQLRPSCGRWTKSSSAWGRRSQSRAAAAPRRVGATPCWGGSGCPVPAARQALELGRLLTELTVFSPDGPVSGGAVADGAYRDHPLFETNADAVFCALQGRRAPAKRHPLGVQLRIEALAGSHLEDDGGDLWHRRIEELDAAACAVCAHRYAVGHACWLGDPAEAVVVLPGSAPPEEFPHEGDAAGRAVEAAGSGGVSPSEVQSSSSLTPKLSTPPDPAYT